MPELVATGPFWPPTSRRRRRRGRAAARPRRRGRHRQPPQSCHPDHRAGRGRPAARLAGRPARPRPRYRQVLSGLAAPVAHLALGRCVRRRVRPGVREAGDQKAAPRQGSIPGVAAAWCGRPQPRESPPTRSQDCGGPQLGLASPSCGTGAPSEGRPQPPGWSPGVHPAGAAVATFERASGSLPP
jgi:hypothetical protein